MRTMNLNSLRRAWILTMVVWGIAPGLVRGDALTSGADFLLSSPGARPAALGGAFSALSDDLNALHFNVAGLASLSQGEVGYARFQSVADVHYDFLAGAIPSGKAGVFALGYLGMGVDAFTSTGDSSVASVSASDMALIAGWGRAWTPWLKAGVGIKYIRREVADLSASAFAGDLSFLVEPMRRLQAGLGFQHLGTDIDLGGKEPLPALTRIGVKVDALEKDRHRLSWAAETVLVHRSRRPVYGTGVEYWYQDMAAARVGYVGNQEGQGIALGAGVRVKGFQFDYAFQPYEEAGSTHRFSGGYRFDTRHGKAALKSAGEVRNAPQGLEARSTDRGVEISWKPTSGNVASYEVKVARENQVAKVVGGLTAPAVLLKDLKMGEIYTVAVRELDDAGRRGPLSKTLRFQAP